MCIRWHCWCSGSMQDSHSCEPGSTPGQRTFLYFFFPIMGSVRSLLFMVVRSCRTFYIAMVKPLISCFPILLLTHLYAAESQEVSKIPISFKDVQPKVGY